LQLERREHRQRFVDPSAQPFELLQPDRHPADLRSFLCALEFTGLSHKGAHAPAHPALSGHPQQPEMIPSKPRPLSRTMSNRMALMFQ